MNNLFELNYNFSEHTILRNMNETTLVYNTDTSDMYELNDVGAELFEILKKNTTMKNVFTELCNIYTVTKEEIYDDVNEFVSRMVELGVVIPIE